MSEQECLHEWTTLYRHRGSGNAVQECLDCGAIIDCGDPADFARGTSMGGAGRRTV